jgi:hypothetical protein
VINSFFTNNFKTFVVNDLLFCGLLLIIIFLSFLGVAVDVASGTDFLSVRDKVDITASEGSLLIEESLSFFSSSLLVKVEINDATFVSWHFLFRVELVLEINQGFFDFINRSGTLWNIVKNNRRLKNLVSCILTVL